MQCGSSRDGVRRTRRGDGSGPASAYDIYVDGEYAGWLERVQPGKAGERVAGIPGRG